jgi:hypothetical protein
LEFLIGFSGILLHLGQWDLGLEAQFRAHSRQPSSARFRPLDAPAMGRRAQCISKGHGNTPARRFRRHSYGPRRSTFYPPACWR